MSSAARLAPLVWTCTVAASGRAEAQDRPPLQAGGLTPPPRDRPPPTETPVETSRALDRAEQEDSGRGLEFAYVEAEGGVGYVGLDVLSKTGSLLAAGASSSAVASVAGAAAGVRLLYVTVGPRVQWAHAGAWDLLTFGLDAGWRVPLGRLEPHGEIGGAYAKLGRVGEDVLGGGRGIATSGFSVRMGAGADYFFSNTFSLGGDMSFELLRLSRAGILLRATDPVAAQALASDASSLGIAVLGRVVAGLHF